MAHVNPYYRPPEQERNKLLEENPEAWQREARLVRVEELLEYTAQLPPEKEFNVLLTFLVEYAGAWESAKNAAMETLVDQFAAAANSYANAVIGVEGRLMELYKAACSVERSDPV